MSGMTCGAGMAMNFGDTNDTATGTSQDNNSSNSNNNNNNNNNPVLKKTHSESSTLTSANAHQYHGHHHHRQNQHQQHQHRGIRVTRSSGSVQTSSSLYKPTKNDYYHNNNDDHHTFATATTASATISYSHTEEEEGSTSEAGMEVVMDQEERLREEQILSLLQDYPTTTTTATATATTTAQEEPYISHTFTAGKHTFTVDTRYSLIRVIGSGAYGVVISAKDAKKEAAVLALKETNRRNNTNKNDGDDNDAESVEVAIKMVPRAFHDEIDAKRILREIKLLQHFQHENIVAIRDMMPPECKYVEDFTDVYMVTDLMETDLHRIIYSKQKLSMDHVQYFVYQVLRGLKYIHSCNVLHRDLKPSNLLVNSNCDLKICDFGLARGIYDDDVPDLDQNRGSLILTEYVVTRWYRAPEIMLACHQYSKPIDVWSVGCIFAELILRKPYFPGDDYIDQLTIISEKLGKLSDSELSFVTSDKAKRFMKKLPNKPPKPLGQQFPSASPEALDLLRKMLSIQPSKRITVEQALAHPFFKQLHSPEDEPVCSHGPFDFSFENEHLHRKRLQELIWEEVGRFRPSALPVAPSRSGTEADSLELSLSRSRTRSSGSRKDP